MGGGCEYKITSNNLIQNSFTLKITELDLTADRDVIDVFHHSQSCGGISKRRKSFTITKGRTLNLGSLKAAYPFSRSN